MSETRQDAIRAHEKASFQGAFGYHDIATFKLVAYELANSHGILEVIVLDEDMAALTSTTAMKSLPSPPYRSRAPIRPM